MTTPAQVVARIEEGLFAMWDALPELFVMSDEEGKIVRISAACRSLLDWERSDMEGHHWYLFAHPDDIAGADAEYNSYRAGGAPLVGYPTRWRNKDGGYVCLYWYTPTTTMGIGRSYSVATLQKP